ncbi:MAG: response regulator [Rhodospirillaceae bacterium]|nr:response regulator [Rhodospirillaceae bacterium]
MAFGKVLIIDDDPDILSYLRTLFEGWGFAVHTADNGVDGIAAARDILPALILLDLNMRRLTGFDTARQLRDTPKTATIPILAVTALKKAEDRDEAHLAGCDAVISKPIDTKAL